MNPLRRVPSDLSRWQEATIQEVEPAPRETQEQQHLWRDYPGPQDPGEHTVVGTVKVLERLHSPELGNERSIYVYLPGTRGTGGRRYPVLYMQDGQNLFDQATSFAGEWKVDEAMEARRRRPPEAIIVGISNTGEERMAEYSPFVDERAGGGRGDEYLDFVFGTLKPLIDAEFPTLPAREHTGIAGSSLGGLIALYAFFRRPEAFAFVGALSPALWWAGRAVLEYVRRAPFNPGRIYLDTGRREGEATLAQARELRRILQEKGYREGGTLRYIEDPRGHHREAAWARRFRSALPFLIPPAPAP